MSEESPESTEWVLPFGQIVVSEAYTLEQSMSLTQNLEKLSALTDKLEDLKRILSDQNLSEGERISNALETLQEEPLQQSVPFVEENKKNMNVLECPEIIMSQPTTKIDLASQDELQSVEKIQKTTAQQGQKQQQVDMDNGIVKQLRNLLRVREEQLHRLRKQKEEGEAQHRQQISELTRKLQISQEKVTGCYCKIEKVKEIGKMNKWLETLNKMLKGAQKQAAMSRDELRRNGEVTARQLKEKDEIIQHLQAQLQMHKSSPNLQLAS